MEPAIRTSTTSPVEKDANGLAASRAFVYRKGKSFKVPYSKFLTEIKNARMLGELGAAERILLVMNENPELTLDEVKGEIHQFIAEVYNLISEKEKLGLKIGVEHFVDGSYKTGRQVCQ